VNSKSDIKHILTKHFSLRHVKNTTRILMIDQLFFNWDGNIYCHNDAVKLFYYDIQMHNTLQFETENSVKLFA